MTSNDAWMQAVQAGDVIRRHAAHRSSNNNLPPGVWQGALAVTGTALLTWPLRQNFFRLFNKHNNKQFQIFLELVITPIQVLTVVQAGLFVGSVYGSHSYLQQFLREQQENRFESTAAVKDVCRELLSVSTTENAQSSLNTHSSHATTSMWNSPTQILQTYQQVLQQCRRHQKDPDGSM